MKEIDCFGLIAESALFLMPVHSTICAKIEGFGAVYITRVLTGWIYCWPQSVEGTVPVFVPLTTYSSPTI